MQVLKIGTRESPLALWQAKKVHNLLLSLNISSELVLIKSKGDQDTTSPLHQLGTVGIFTKALDDALLEENIDIAVHSCKDLPTIEPEGISYAAYLDRGPHEDIIVTKSAVNIIPESEITIATGSIRRAAQWKNKFPSHNIVNLRGNVNTRLSKVENENWFGGIFAKAGLERLKIENINFIILDWMIPAPAQGVVAVVCRQKDKKTIELLEKINSKETRITSLAERKFLNILEGGCSAPIGAKAEIKGNQIHMEGVLLSKEGNDRIYYEHSSQINQYEKLAEEMALKILGNGGKSIISDLKNDIGS